MDKRLKYVREKRVAPLLNDMLALLLRDVPLDPLMALITFLERRRESGGGGESDDDDDGGEGGGEGEGVAPVREEPPSDTSTALSTAPAPAASPAAAALLEELRGNERAFAELVRSAAQGGDADAAREAADLSAQLERHIDDVATGAAAMNQALGILSRAAHSQSEQLPALSALLRAVEGHA